MILIMKALNYLSLKKILARLKKRNICINVFYYENNLVFPVDVSDKNIESCTDLLMITDENKPNYVYIKGFNRFMCNNTRFKKIL